MALNEIQRKEIIHLIKRERLSVDYKKGAKWQNFSKNQTLDDVLVLNIKNLDALQKIVKKIYALNLDVSSEARITCRPASGGKGDNDELALLPGAGPDNKLYSHSFSLPPWVEADIVINLDFAISDKYAIEIIGENTVILRPGIQLKAFDEILEKKGYATAFYGSLINRVRPEGLAFNFGNGINGPYSQNIKAITILMMNGEKRTIRREDCPETFDYYLAFGLFGIVIEIEMDIRPVKKLKKIETAMTFAEFIEGFESGRLPEKPLFEVFCNDLTNKEGNNVKLIEFEEVECDVEDENFEPEKANLEQWFQIKLQDNLRVVDVLARYPQLGPLYMKYIVARYGIGEGRKESIAKASAQNHYQKWYPYNLNMFAGIFPCKRNYQQMLDAFKKLAQETQAAKERGEAPVSFGAYARMAENKHYPTSMSPFSTTSNEELLCVFDVVSSPHAVGFKEFRERFLMEYLIKEMGAKLHWGKDITPEMDFEAMYPEALPMFKKLLEEFHNQNEEFEEGNKLSLERSPFLTYFPCEIFKMDEKYWPTFQKRCTPERTAEPQTVLNGVSGLKHFLQWIEGQDDDDIHKENLRKCVKELHLDECAKLPASSGLSIFSPAPAEDEYARRCPPTSCTLF